MVPKVDSSEELAAVFDIFRRHYGAKRVMDTVGFKFAKRLIFWTSQFVRWSYFCVEISICSIFLKCTLSHAQQRRTFADFGGGVRHLLLYFNVRRPFSLHFWHRLFTQYILSCTHASMQREICLSYTWERRKETDATPSGIFFSRYTYFGSREGVACVR